MPGPRRPHRHAAKHDTVSINSILSTGRFDRLEDVGFARPPITVLDTPEWVEFKLLDIRGGFVGVHHVARIEAIDETQFTQADRPGAPVEDDV